MGAIRDMGFGLETTFRRARGLIAIGQTVEAAGLYSGILSRFPGNHRARKALALLPAKPPAGTSPGALYKRATELRMRGAPEAAIEASARP